MNSSNGSSSEDGPFWSTFDGENLSNNLFTDLGPLLSLFGERVATAFMSQSLVWTDNLLFAIGPLGVITAIVCAIRVGGPHWLKAFIGRGREPKSEVEKELMSSTSAEVCEMWNGNSLVRVVGQSRVVGLALVFDEDGRRLKRHRSKDGADNSSESLVTSSSHNSSSDGEDEGSASPENADDSDGDAEDASSVRSFSTASTTTTDSGDDGSDYPSFEGGSGSGESSSGDSGSDLSASESGSSESEFNWPIEEVDLGIYTKDEWPVIFGVPETSDTDAREGDEDTTHLSEKDISVPEAAGNDLEHGADTLSSETIVGAASDRRAGRTKKAPLLGSSPNISLNYQVSHNVTELAWFALLSILLQGVVLAIDGLLTYYWAYTNNGQAVSSAAFPLLVIGTGLLTIGLYLCSFIIQDGTRETRLRLRSENDGREVRLFWLQQRGRVGDQHFGSYAIFAADGRRDIILSEREDYFEGTDNTTNREPLTIRSFTIALLTVVASFLSIVGYVVQFIAFRQMHWFAAVLQLILCLVMTGIRAWVRRYFAEQPRTEALPENHELDWLATRPGFYQTASSLWGPDDDKTAKPSAPANRARSRKVAILLALARRPQRLLFYLFHRRTERTPWYRQGTRSAPIEWLVTSGKAELENQASNLPGSVASDDFDGETLPSAEFVLQTRQFLQARMAPDWESSNTPASEAAKCLAKAITGVMDILSDAELFEMDSGWSDVTTSASFKWDVNVGHDLVAFHNMRSGKTSKWNTDVARLEAAISLWSFSLGHGKGLGSVSADETIRTTCCVPISNDAAIYEFMWWSNFGDDMRGLQDVAVNDDNLVSTRIVGLARQYKRPDSKELCIRVFDPEILFEASIKNTSAHQLVFENPTQGQQGLAFGCAWYLFAVFLQQVATLIVKVQGRTVVKVDDKFLRLRTAMLSASKYIRLSNTAVQRLILAIADSGIGSSDLAAVTVMTVLLCQDKLPASHCIVDHVVNRVRKIEEDQHWIRATVVYCNLMKIAGQERGHMLGMFPLKALAASTEFLSSLTDAESLYESVGINDKLESTRRARKRLCIQINQINIAMRKRLQEHYTLLGQRRRLADLAPLEAQLKPVSSANSRSSRKKLLDDLLNGGFGDHFPQPSSAFAAAIDDETVVAMSGLEDIFSWTPLHYYVQWFSTDYVTGKTIRRLQPSDTGRYAADANEQNLLGESPLHLAVRAGEKSMIDPLIQRGAHIDLPNRAGDTPLHLAARLDFSVGRPLVTMLYERGASVNLRNSYGLTPLHEACRAGNLANARRLLELQANSRARDKQGFTALHYFCAQSSHHDLVGTNIAQLLRDLGASETARDHCRSRTPLHYAAKSGFFPVVVALLEDQPDPIEVAARILDTDGDDMHAIDLAAEHGRADVVKYLLGSLGIEAGTEGSLRKLGDEGFEYIFEVSLESGCIETVKTILSYDKDVLRRCQQYAGDSLLGKSGSKEVAEFLIIQGIDPLSSKLENRPPIFSVHDFGTFKVLFDKYVELDQVIPSDQDGNTLHFMAKQFGTDSDIDEEALSEVLGTPFISQIINDKDSRGETALHLALKHRPPHQTLVRQLLRHGAQADIKNKASITPLQTAIRRGNVDAISLLFKCDVRPSLEDAKFATLRNNAIALALILDTGELDVNEADSEGRTLLHLVLDRQEGIFNGIPELLIQYGADYTKADNANVTPLEKLDELSPDLAPVWKRRWQMILDEGISKNKQDGEEETENESLDNEEPSSSNSVDGEPVNPPGAKIEPEEKEIEEDEIEREKVERGEIEGKEVDEEEFMEEEVDEEALEEEEANGEDHEGVENNDLEPRVSP